MTRPPCSDMIGTVEEGLSPPVTQHSPLSFNSSYYNITAHRYCSYARRSVRAVQLISQFGGFLEGFAGCIFQEFTALVGKLYYLGNAH